MMEKNKNTSSLFLALDVILVCIIVGFIFYVYIFNHFHTSTDNTIDKNKITSSDSFFDTSVIQAKSIYVYDVKEQKVIFQKNEMAERPLASLTKLMTALVATNLAPDNYKITILPQFLEADGDTGLLSGEVWNMSDLRDFSLVVSSNDGALALSSSIGATADNTVDTTLGRQYFINQMNQEAKTLGLKQTYFINETGLDESIDEAGAYGSAQDVGSLLEYLLLSKPAVLEVTRNSSITVSSSVESHTGQNTDTDINKIPGLLASKTGYTDLAGGNLAIVFDVSIGHPIIIVALDSTYDGRFTDMVTLVNDVMKYESTK